MLKMEANPPSFQKGDLMLFSTCLYWNLVEIIYWNFGITKLNHYKFIHCH